MSPNEARNLLDNYLYMLEATVDHYDKKFRADAKNPNLKKGERLHLGTSKILKGFGGAGGRMDKT
jgi:hypothetical protein